MELEQFIKKQARPLPVFLLLDTSGSMSGSKIDTLNQCVREMIQDFKSERMTEVELQLCVITFGNGGAQVHTRLQGISSIEFTDLTANGNTPLGGALSIASEIINDKEQVTGKGYRPVVVLVSDGYPNDFWEQPLNDFVSGKRTSKCDRWALGIGEGYDKDMLARFLSNSDKPVFDASVASEITKFFKFVTLSTITRTKSVDKNSIIKLTDIQQMSEDENPPFNFDF